MTKEDYIRMRMEVLVELIKESKRLNGAPLSNHVDELYLLSWLYPHCVDDKKDQE